MDFFYMFKDANSRHEIIMEAKRLSSAQILKQSNRLLTAAATFCTIAPVKSVGSHRGTAYFDTRMYLA